MNNHTLHDSRETSATSAAWLLGIDTSTEQIGVALTNGNDLLEASLPGGRHQSRELLPIVDWLLAQHGLAIGDIGVVAVATGPGSFTGLRVGLSIAKGLAIAQGTSVIGVPTLEIVAWPYRMSGTPILAVLSAGRSRFAWSIADPGVTAGPPVNSNLDAVLAAVRERPELLVAGELSRSAYEHLTSAGAHLESRLLGSRRAAALADLGWRRWANGEIDDATSLEPIYLHGVQTALPPRSQR